MNRNYAKELDELLSHPENKGKSLFLHSCCAPCSSYVLEYLRKYFRITVFYFNPNITEDAEYLKRVEEQKRLIAEYNNKLGCALTKVESENSFKGEDVSSLSGTKDADEESAGKEPAYPIEIVEGDHCKEKFFQAVKGLEKCGEGSERCFACFRLRLEETARRAREAGAEYFATTLTISPLKNAVKLNEIGEEMAKKYEVKHLPSDFKKKNGYKRSIELSTEYGLYRQDYCGCIYSKTESEERKKAKEEGVR